MSFDFGETMKICEIRYYFQFGYILSDYLLLWLDLLCVHVERERECVCVV